MIGDTKVASRPQILHERNLTPCSAVNRFLRIVGNYQTTRCQTEEDGFEGLVTSVAQAVQRHMVGRLSDSTWLSTAVRFTKKKHCF
jgi:hypothetical protein